MRLTASVVFASACLLSACTSSPTTSTPVQNTPAPSLAPASIQILASTRPDSQLDVTAKVLTAQGTFVANATVAFAVDNGSVTPPTAITDVNGLAHSIVTSSGKVTITASVGSITASTATTGTVAALAVSIGVPAVQIGTASAFTAVVSGLAPGASVTSYAWDFGDANTAQTTTSSTTHLYAAVGSYNASVKVTDSLGRSVTASATAAVAVVPPPPPPPPAPAPSYTVTLAASPASVLIGGSATLTATVVPQNGAPAPASYAWDCGTGAPIVTTLAPTNFHACAYPSVGPTASQVTVTGGTVTGHASVTVTASTAIPVISVSCSAGVHLGAASTCIVSATLGGAVVLSGNITSVSWDFGDGVTTTNSPGNVSPAHTYGSANPFTVVASNVQVVGATGPGSGSTSTTILP